jgi:hypothetical protein
LGSFGNFAFFWAGLNQPPFLNAEGNEENEGKTGTGIKIRKAGRQEWVKTFDFKPQAPGVQTPTVEDDDLYLFITRDQRDARPMAPGRSV